MHKQMTRDEARRARRRRVRREAQTQDGVLSRRQLYGTGLSRWEVGAELRAERWRLHGRQTIAVHTGDLAGDAMLWHAVIEAGARGVLDGVSALVAAGLTGFTIPAVRVSVPRGARVVKIAGIDIRQTRRLRPSDRVGAGIPRVWPWIAAVRGALWARTDREAATLLAMVVQQRLTTAKRIGLALLDVRRDRRRRFVEMIVLDLIGGAQSLGELDFAGMARRRGLPEPDRQVVRRGRDGRIYLDVIWEAFAVVVEIDGIHHAFAQNLVNDALRHNAVTLRIATVLRLPLLGLRVASDAFFAQIAEALVAGGWIPPDVIRSAGSDPQNV
ncbi:hypothetical protein [Mumia zhuanghuii]|uniref:hypothetical protein n=1 Tax=Mumia zhuanghuii TaxID=2585211 RepID=UPI00362DF50C